MPRQIHDDPNATIEMKLVAAGEKMLAAGFAPEVAADQNARSEFLRSYLLEAPRPKGGHLPYEGTSPHVLARDGDLLGAAIAQARRENEDAARSLHSIAVSLRDELDRTALDLERGRRRYALSRSSWLAELPLLGAALDDTADALDQIEALRDYAKNPTVEAKARQIEAAADALDAEILHMGLKGAHPLAAELRREANRMRSAQQREEEARQMRRAQEDARKQAALARRPLGKREGDWLAGLDQNPRKRTRGAAEQKAVDTLLKRGYIVIAADRGEAAYEITDAGKQALAREDAAVAS